MIPRLLLFFVLVVSTISCSKEHPTPSSDQSFFDAIYTDSDSAVEITIHTALPELIHQRTDKYQPAAIEVAMPSGKNLSFTAKVKTRGKTRKKICDFPPLKINLKDEELLAQGFTAELDKFKLVTDCKGEPELVAKEMLVYRIYNFISENSFRVQPLKIKYVDSNDPHEVYEHFGFLIESHDALAQRRKAVPRKVKAGQLKAIDAAQYRQMSVFQYMIGNTDWNLAQSHNIKFIQLADKSVPTPVPYDFDYSGLVNAHYAIPHPSLPIDDVQDRYLQWRGGSAEHLIHSLKQITTRQEDILQYCQQYAWLSQTDKAEVINYLQAFFDLAKAAAQKSGDAVVQSLQTASTDGPSV
ncbi:MAG: hypothetical protein MRY78_09855 [Saprospiraceae bacterium]|nr:hypothetical protein [Saprospiraceae bacterium]